MTDTLPDPTAPVDRLEPTGAGTDAVPAATTKPGILGVLTVVVALVAAAGLATGILAWQKLAAIQESLARQSAQAQSQSLEAQTLAKQAVSLAQAASANVALQEARLSEATLQRSQLDELMRSLSRSRDENLVVDIESALRLAQQQAQLTGSVEPLLAALRSADQRIVRAAQPHMAKLQRTIARDIERIQSATVSDTPAMLLRLDELLRLADQLVLANAVTSVDKAPKPPQPPASVAERWWDNAVQLVWGEARRLVQVSRIEHPEAALLSPEQSFFVRENFKLRLLNARMGLLARQIDSARSDLTEAGNSLRKYFDANSRKTQTAAQLLQQLQGQMRNLQLPRIDDTLAALASAAPGH